MKSTTETGDGRHDSLTTAPRMAEGIAACAWLVGAGAAAGAVAGLLPARATLARQGWVELGFARLAEQAVREETLGGAAQGAAAGAALALASAVLLALPGIRKLLAPAALLDRLARRESQPGLLTAGAAALAALALAAAGWLSRSEVVLAVGALALWPFALRLLCARAKSRAQAPPGARARVFAAFWLAGPLLCAPLAASLAGRLAPSVGRPRAAAATLALLAAAFLVLWARARAALEGRRPRVPGAARLLAALLLVPAFLPLFSARLAGTGPSNVHPSAGVRPNVLLIAIDTLRADRTTMGGVAAGARDWTPNLRRLAERGILFENATSQAPWTMPAMASIFTGRYPLEHGAHTRRARLSEREVDLAEVLNEAGWWTAGVVSNYYVDTVHGFAQGFQEYDEEAMPSRYPISSAEVTDRALAMLGRRRDPFFLYVHYFDPHAKYQDHPERDWQGDYQGWLAAGDLDFDDMLANRHLLDPSDLRYLQDLYEEEIAYTDAQIGRLLKALDADPELERNTAILVVADHGEEFLEHGQLFHLNSLHGELLSVPLLVVPPAARAGDAAGTRVAEVVETRAVFPTVLDLAGIDWRPPEGSAAHSLMELVRPGSQAGTHMAFSSQWDSRVRPDPNRILDMASVREDRWKLIWDFTRSKRALYDVAADPGETVDRAADERPVTERLSGLVQTWLEGMPEIESAPATADISDAVRAELEALGYL